MKPLDDKPHFFGDFARHGLLHGLPRLNETGERRHQARRELRLAGEKTRLFARTTPGDQDENCRIGAWEVLRFTARITATKGMARLLADGGAAAATAEALPAMPVHEATSIGQQRALASRQASTHPTELDEPPGSCVGWISGGIRVHFDRKAGIAGSADAEKRRRIWPVEQRPARRRSKHHGPQPAIVYD